MKIQSLSLITATLLCTQTLYATEVLEDIIITSSTKTAQSIKNTTSNITVITAEDIEENGYQTVAEAINTISGISVTHAGGIGQQTSFFIRGADSGKVLILLDGMRLNDPSTTNGTALLDSLTTSNIAQIEIIKGATGSIWGSNASAGIINIITKEAKNGLHGSLGLTYGSYTTQGADLTLAYKDKQVTVQVVASYLDTDGFSALSPKDAEKDAHTNKNINLKLGYAFNENSQIDLSFNDIKTKTNYDDAYSTKKENDNYSHATAQQKNLAVNYYYTHDNYSATLHASEGKYNRDYFTTGNFGDNHNVYKAILKEYAFINTLKHTNAQTTLGLEYKSINGFHKSNTYSKNQSDYTNKAIYLSNTYHINEETLLESNLRYETYSKFEKQITYKLGMKHQHRFFKGFETSMNYYSSADAPSAYQLSQAISEKTLMPSYTKGYDISMAYKDLLSVTYFNNKVNDTIDYVGVFPNAGYANIEGTSRFSGLEIESNYIFSKLNIITSTNYTHLFDFTKEDGTNLRRRAKDTFNASMSYYTKDEMYFGINIHYIGERDDNGHNTGNYTLWGLNFKTEILNNLDLNINAKNIFDKDYQSTYGYSTEGRSLYTTLKYTF